ncbi:MAG: YkgJ family cysteine cluster protein [bacterium]|nr:YkgJ family cysteine cluster protein [bacterium]
MSESLWYREGLRFGCTRCGNCCGGESGSVRLDNAEVRLLARRFDVTSDEFRAMYTVMRGRALSLRERRNRDCIFYDSGLGCRVYEDRPRQCRAWPFWRTNLHSSDAWAETAAHCPGVNQGPLLDVDEIDAIARDDGTSGALRSHLRDD